MRANKRPIAIIRRSCSDSSVTASKWIEFSEATACARRPITAWHEVLFQRSRRRSHRCLGQAIRRSDAWSQPATAQKLALTVLQDHEAVQEPKRDRRD